MFTVVRIMEQRWRQQSACSNQDWKDKEFHLNSITNTQTLCIAEWGLHKNTVCSVLPALEGQLGGISAHRFAH